MLEEPQTYRCARCGEAKARVQRLLVGPHAGALLCEDCVAQLIAVDEDRGPMMPERRREEPTSDA